MKITEVRRSRFLQLDLITIYAIAVALVFVPIITNSKFLLHLCGKVGIYFIFVAGFNLCAGVAGLVSLGHAALFAVAAYTSALLPIKIGVPFWASMILGVLVTLLASMVIGFISLRAKGFVFVLVTLAINWIIYRIAWNWVPLTGGEPGIIVQPATIGHTSLLEDQFIYIIGAVSLFSLIAARNVRRSRTGRALDSIRSSEVVAGSAGIDVWSYKFKVFVLSAFFAGVAGAFHTYFIQFVNPELASIDISFGLLVIMLLGGWGTQFGPLLGAAIYIFLPAILSFLQEYSAFLWAFLMLLVLLIAPKGLVGLAERLAFIRRQSPHTIQVGSAVKALELLKREESGSILLEVKNVTKAFGGLTALNHVSLAIYANQIHGLIGPNGAGKTTLLNLICGFMRPDEGEIILKGKRIDGLPLHRIAQMGISRTFQGTIVCEGMSSIDDVRLGQHTRTKSGIISSALSTSFVRAEEGVYRQLAIDLLHFTEAEDKALVEVDSLPYNYRKFAELARALSSRPMILLLDEPTSGLTMGEAESMMKKLRQLKDAGLGILFIDHNVKAVMSVADTISVLDFGQRIAGGSPEEIQNNEEVIAAYLGRKRK